MCQNANLNIHIPYISFILGEKELFSFGLNKGGEALRTFLISWELRCRAMSFSGLTVGIVDFDNHNKVMI